MNVKEYAVDVDKSIEEILEMCKKLDINVTNEDDMLSEDDIIMLDNELPTEDEEKAGKEPVVIGEGEHTRYIVDRERFLSKL